MHKKEVEKKGEYFVKWFSELSNKDIAIAGGKGASLAEMYNIKMPIPPGFVVTAQAFDYFLKKTKLDEKIREILKDLDINNTEKLNKVSVKIRSLIESAELPEEMKDEIIEAYDILGAEVGNSKEKNALGVLDNSKEPFVAVRSSATTEDLADASFAGQQDTYLNTKGKHDLIVNAKKCMSSLFTARAIYYRQKKGFDHSKALLCVVVQKMVNSEKSGVMFTINPIKGDKNIVIEAVWGLGEGIVSGKIKPDHYVVDSDLDNFRVVDMEVSNKKTAIIRDEKGHNKEITLKEEMANSQVLTNHELKILSQYGKQLEQHYGKPQDIEFAVDKSVFIVQSRPITTVFKERNDEKASGKMLLNGMGASPGISSGKVKIVHGLDELEKVKDGDVMVTEMTNPDMVVAMQRAAGIVTDEGGVTSHAAIVSREMGIPCVVGTGDATKKLKDGDEITVDGNSGKVFEGKGKTMLKVIEPILPTKTQIKVIVDLPDYAERASRSKVRAVGLTRMEGIIAEGGKHPMKFVKEKNMKPYTKIIYSGIKKISHYFEEMWIRTSDIRSDEYQHLEGAPQKVEANPMLGNHGVRFSLKHKDIMSAEIEAIKKVAEENPHKKYGVMVPQVISLQEVQETKRIAAEVGIPKNVVVGIMVETPAAVQIIEDICKEGINFISFGTNDLTQFTLALDRGNEEVQDLYTEMHPAVLRSLSQVIRTCKKYGVKTSICGQAASREEMAKFLVSEGISSLSVNADAARKISEVVAKVENEMSGVVEYERENMQLQNEKNEEKHLIVNTNKPKKIIDYEHEDIEEVILKELDENGNEYVPGSLNINDKQDIPKLNDAIVSNEEESEVEKVEGESVLSSEWTGEDP